MGPAARNALDALSDGQFHSGQQLAQASGVTRAAIWKQVRAIRELGVTVESVPGRGYRIPGGLELLDADRIRLALEPEERNRDIYVFPVLDSTNRWLAERREASSGTVCLAEMQTAGRGRRGRRWVSPFGGNLYLSMLWHFEHGPAALGGLSLAVAVATLRGFTSLGIAGVRIKWPNDLYWDDRKLAGTLVEVSGESTGPCRAVVGMGINLRVPDTVRGQIDQPWTELRELPGGEAVGRNQLAAALVREWSRAMTRFAREGLEPFLPEFHQHDMTRGREVMLMTARDRRQGRAIGVDEQGRLRVRTPDGDQVFADGEISLREV